MNLKNNFELHNISKDDDQIIQNYQNQSIQMNEMVKRIKSLMYNHGQEPLQKNHPSSMQDKINVIVSQKRKK
ncbi:hypothetical protein pb186bvf_013148 [Paramecium bursaria]